LDSLAITPFGNQSKGEPIRQRTHTLIFSQCVCLNFTAKHTIRLCIAIKPFNIY